MTGRGDDGTTLAREGALRGAAGAGGDDGQLAPGGDRLEPRGEFLRGGIRPGDVESVVFAVEGPVADQLDDNRVGLAGLIGDCRNGVSDILPSGRPVREQRDRRPGLFGVAGAGIPLCREFPSELRFPAEAGDDEHARLALGLDTGPRRHVLGSGGFAVGVGDHGRHRQYGEPLECATHDREGLIETRLCGQSSLPDSCNAGQACGSLARISHQWPR